MSSGVCLRFKQNAWKKELCSNCYRQKDEHQVQVKNKINLQLPLKEASQSILNSGKKKNSKKNVRFRNEESEIIGYSGGESEIEEDDDFCQNKIVDKDKDSPNEDDKALELLTKSNTNFNSTLDNLSINNVAVTTPLSSEVPKIEEVPKEEPQKKTIVITSKKEERGNPEGRKTQITRGSIITKTHEQAKNKLYIQNIQKNDKKVKNEDVVTIKCKSVEEEDLSWKESDKGLSVGNEVTVEVLKLLNGKNSLPESREMAGEPDGKADCDEAEPQITPPPRSSFLHRENVLTLSSSKTSPLPPLKVTEKSVPTTPVIPVLKIQTSPVLPHNSSSAPVLTRYDNILSEKIDSDESNLNIQEVVKCKRQAPQPPVCATPEPLPRRRNSHDINQTLSEKRKMRVRQTLKKFLWFSNKDEEPAKYENVYIPPRPRPQIIHPLDLNKSGVQVLPLPSPESPCSSSPTSSIVSTCSGRPTKPPPPPRSESLNLLERLKPTTNFDNVYENLGEGRCGIAPTKPQRSGSVRYSQHEESDNLYEPIEINRNKEESKEDDIYYPYMSFQRNKSTEERGIVHSTLEENYGAVVIANLEALTNILKKIKDKTPDVPKFQKDFKNMSWDSINLEGKAPVKIDTFTFIEAKFGEDPITLALTNTNLSLPKILTPVHTFKDKVPSKILYVEDESTIMLLEQFTITDLNSYLTDLEKSPDGIREGILVLLKLLKFVNRGKETVRSENFAVFSTKNEPISKPIYIPTNGNENVPVREAVLSFVNKLLDGLPLEKVLIKCSLGEMQEVVQVWLWGPTKLLQNSTLKRWLDLERAKVLQSLVCSNPSSPQKEHLYFLVHATAISISKALKLLHS